MYLREIAKFGARHHRVWGDGNDHVEPSGSAAALPERDHAGLRFCRSGAHGFKELCWTADATLSGTSQWRRLQPGAPERMDVPLGKGPPRRGCGADVADGFRLRPHARRTQPYSFRANPRADLCRPGHALDLSNKAFELLEFIGWEYATEVLPLIVEHLTQSRSEEEQGTWRAPIDLVELIQSAEEALRRNPPRTREGVVCEPDFYSQVLGEHPQAIIRAVAEAMNHGAPPVEVARHLTLAAAWRLARFPQSNDIEDWFAPSAHFFVLQCASSGAGTG